MNLRKLFVLMVLIIKKVVIISFMVKDFERFRFVNFHIKIRNRFEYYIILNDNF